MSKYPILRNLKVDYEALEKLAQDYGFEDKEDAKDAINSENSDMGGLVRQKMAPKSDILYGLWMAPNDNKNPPQSVPKQFLHQTTWKYPHSFL